VAQALVAEGHNGVANVVRILDAVEPLAVVEHTASLNTVLGKIQAGEDPTWLELRAVYGSDAELSASPAHALPAQTG
jgi:hypothetical protein